MAAPPPPIIATCTIVGEDAPVAVPADHPLVNCTAFLDWAPAPAGAGGVARVQLSYWQTLKVFGARCSASRSPTDLAASRRVHPLNICLTGGFWTRVLNEYVASGLLAVVAGRREELIAGIAGLTIATPANLVAVPADWLLGEDPAFIAAVAYAPAHPAIPAQPARGRRGAPDYVPAMPRVPAAPAVAAVPGRPALDPALTFLTFTSILDLETDGDAPWTLICYLAGMLGACLDQAERVRGGSQVQLSARALAAGCRQRYCTMDGDHHSLAGNLKDFLNIISLALPVLMLGSNLAATDLRAEGRDAITYSKDDVGRRLVEQARIFAFGPTCASPAARARASPRPDRA